MRNHDHKTRDMARSVLPSKRQVAIERRNIHHAERNAVRRRLHVLRYEDGIDTPDLNNSDRQIREMVNDRRLYDKVAPLIRWATHRIETDPFLRDMSIDGQLAHFRSILPSDLIGRHAMSHLEWVLNRD